MDKLENLTLSENIMDTSMAMELIQNDNLEWPASDKYLVYAEPNEIKEINSLEMLDLFEQKSIPNANKTGKVLAKLLEENVEMFVQLEHIARGTSPQDVRNGHIKLMTQIMQCSDALWNVGVYNCGIVLVVTESTPLYIMGVLAAQLYDKTINHRGVIWVAEKKMKHLCLFFVKLCRDAGLDIVLVYGSSDTLSAFGKNYDEIIVPADVSGGCTGVISGWSDMDSALDVFIDSSITAPWRLKQIYVQESEFEDFKKLLASRVRDSSGCSQHYVIGDKTFAVETLCTSTDTFTIPVLAYRTNKELLTLINTPYLSVWAANSAEANEIALKTQTANVVWLNEYASFDGLPRSALPLYNLYTYTDEGVLDETLKIAKSWAQLKTSQRLEIVTDAIKGREKCERIMKDLEKWRSDDFIHITDTSICFGVQVPLGTVVLSDELYDNHNIIFKALINGNLVLADIDDESFLNAGIPLQNRVKFVTLEYLTSIFAERFKVVRSNYGTMFAN